MEKLKPANVRAELGLKQEELAEDARLTKATIVNFEKGRPVQRLSAYCILHALNVHRVRHGMTPLTLGEIEMAIRGESQPKERQQIQE